MNKYALPEKLYNQFLYEKLKEKEMNKFIVSNGKVIWLLKHNKQFEKSILENFT